MTPSCDSTMEAIGKGGIGCREADGFDVAGEADGAAEADECNVALRALFTVAWVGDDLRHRADHSVVAVGVQLVGPQLYLILVLAVFSGEAVSRRHHPLIRHERPATHVDSGVGNADLPGPLARFCIATTCDAWLDDGTTGGFGPASSHS